MFLHVHMDVSMFVCMWRSEDSFPEPVLFLHLVVLGIKLRLSGKCLHPLNHLDAIGYFLFCAGHGAQDLLHVRPVHHQVKPQPWLLFLLILLSLVIRKSF